MTDGEKLNLILYRMDKMEEDVEALAEANKEVWRLMSKQRVSEEVLRRVDNALVDTSEVIKKIWDKHDELSAIVKPNHQSWTETAKHQKGFMVAATTLLLGSVAAMLGLS